MDFASALNIISATIISLGGTSVVILGLSTYLGKIISKRVIGRANEKFQIELNEIKNRNTRELEELRNKLYQQIKRAEQFHSISQKTYEELFRKKIEIYSKINENITEYHQTLKEDGMFEYNNCPPMIYYQFFKKIRILIENHRIYISDELSNKYDQLYNKIAPLILELDMEKIFFQANNQEGDLNGIYDLDLNGCGKMVDETTNEMKNVIKQISEDISLIRSKIDLSRD